MDFGGSTSLRERYCAVVEEALVSVAAGAGAGTGTGSATGVDVAGVDVSAAAEVVACWVSTGGVELAVSVPARTGADEPPGALLVFISARDAAAAENVIEHPPNARAPFHVTATWARWRRERHVRDQH